MRVIPCLSISYFIASASAFISTNRASEARHHTESLLQSSMEYAATVEPSPQHKKELVHSLPPIDRNQMTKYEIEFREMLEAMIFSNHEMKAITESRLRTLYEGVAASYYEAAVYRAFEVLYADYAPLRVAGRMIHHQLTSIMKESREYQQSQIEAVKKCSTFTGKQIESFWLLFTLLTNDRELSPEHASQYLGLSQDDMKVSKRGLTFEQFMFFYKDLPFDTIVDKLQEAVSMKSLSRVEELDKKRLKYSERYDEMLVQFAEWKDIIPDGQGRRLDILRGCFVGSENPKVVESLRIIYVDYAALRMSGNWIYKLVSALMSRAMRQR